tara:strand:+ start:29 stop:1288 length:1260 start_codon:yes stop_codon:yes gene_type:complete
MSKIKPQTIVAIAITLCIVCTILYSFMKPSSGTVVSSEKKGKEEKADVGSQKELVEAVNDLESIKDRLKNAENYREYYRSETNNGLTVIGTVMEQMIDVMVAVLKQPLVAEAVAKRIVNKQDADEMAEYIEILGQGIVKEVEETPILKCRKARTFECTGQGDSKACGFKEAEGEVPTENCAAYEVNHMAIREGSRNAAANLYNKVLDIVTKVEEQDKIYRITKNVAVDNVTQYAIANSWKDEDIQRLSDDFPDQNNFTDAALGHYKYLGHDLRLELGESVNIIELTDDEKGHLPHHIRNRNMEEEIKSQKFVKVSIDLYEEANYKGNHISLNAEFPERETIKFGHSSSNPLKSFKISEGVTLIGTNRDTGKEEGLTGPMEDNDFGSGLINTRLFVSVDPSVVKNQIVPTPPDDLPTSGN